MHLRCEQRGPIRGLAVLILRKDRVVAAGQLVEMAPAKRELECDHVRENASLIERLTKEIADNRSSWFHCMIFLFV